MNTSLVTTLRQPLRTLSVAALCVPSLGVASCGEAAEPEEELVDVEALELALDRVHEAEDHSPLDDIEAAANRRLREEVRRGTVTPEEARRVSRAIAGTKTRLLTAIESGRLTIEEACEIFRREIANLFRRLRESKQREDRG